MGRGGCVVATVRGGDVDDVSDLDEPDPDEPDDDPEPDEPEPDDDRDDRDDEFDPEACELDSVVVETARFVLRSV
jgi:hypothetical protein